MTNYNKISASQLLAEALKMLSEFHFFAKISILLTREYIVELI